MTLCSMCGGFTDFDFAPVMPASPILDLEPYCSRCGKLKNTACGLCNGKGYTIASSLIPEYCTRCGSSVKRQVRQHCIACGGSGKRIHVCGS